MDPSKPLEGTDVTPEASWAPFDENHVMPRRISCYTKRTSGKQIKAGLKDEAEGRLVPHEKVFAKYARKRRPSRKGRDMNDKKTVIEAALRLPRKHRQDLFDKLLKSLIDPEVIRAGAELAERRMQAYRRGETGGKPAREVLKRLRQKKRIKQ